MKLYPIKDKLLVFFSFFILIIFIICIYASVYIDTTQNLFVSSISINKDIMELIRSTASVKYFGEQVITTSDFDKLNQYLQFSVRLKNRLNELSGMQTNDIYLIEYKNIVEMIGTFLDQMDNAVNASRFGEQTVTLNYIDRASRTFYLIENSGIHFSEQILAVTIDDYERVISIQKDFRIYVSIMIATILLYSYVYIFYFSNNITYPLNKIATKAKEISRGVFNDNDINIHTNDELVLIGDAFNKMNKDIIRLLEEERIKVQLEKELNQEQNRNLVVKNAWKDAELRALQAQLNPHFLFNTLNIIAQKAVLNDIDNTTILIKSLSKILRYNLSNFDAPVTIKEEMDIVKQYGEIMKARYNDKITIHYSIDKRTYEESIPRMIIQPLVENCIIHGYNASIRKEMTIEIRIFIEHSYIHLHIWDDGIGFEREVINKVLKVSQDNEEVDHKGHTTGIGIANIKKRLEMLYVSQEVIDIESEKMSYSLIKIKLPIDREDEEYV